jgi:hypothetical protein
MAGYCARVAVKGCNMCEKCREVLVINRQLNMDLEGKFTLIENLTREGLLYPTSDVVNVVILNYLTVTKLISDRYEQIFLKEADQRKVVINLTLDKLLQDDFSLVSFTCKDHSVGKIRNKITKTATNMLLNKYAKRKNDLYSLSKLVNLKVRKFN